MIALRSVEPEDEPQLYAWRREPEVDRWMDADPPSNPDVHSRWFAELTTDPDRRGWIVMQNKKPCGFMQISGVTSRQRRAQWRWYIGEPDARGKGAGRAAQALGLDLAFAFGLRKVWSEVVAGNEAAMKAQAAAGFRREGYMRRHAFKHGQEYDVVLLAIFAEEWAERRAAVRRSLHASGVISREGEPPRTVG